MLQPLLLLANEGTENGRIMAAHALARIAISQNPEIAFPGQRVCALLNNNQFQNSAESFVTFIHSLFSIFLSLCVSHYMHLLLFCCHLQFISLEMIISLKSLKNFVVFEHWCILMRQFVLTCTYNFRRTRLLDL